MKIIAPGVQEIVFHIPEGYSGIETWLESVGRTCYKSEAKITNNSAETFVRMLETRGHHAMLEHAMVSARIIADRGLSHELVRHRIASFAQESTRYCNYGKGKFDNQITVIEQPGVTVGTPAYDIWYNAMVDAETHYLALLKAGAAPQIARSVLPIGLKTEIVISANLREWITIFSLRCDTPAHPIIRGVMLDILNKLNERLPSIYGKQAERFSDALEHRS